jgi:hypothetical protein
MFQRDNAIISIFTLIKKYDTFLLAAIISEIIYFMNIY